MIAGFNPTAGQIIEGLVLLLSIGLNGLFIELIKQGHTHEEELQANVENLWETHKAAYKELAEKNAALEEVNASLVMNQKPVPWNKGKKGYKLNRKPKEVTYVLNTEQPVIAAWDKDGNQTVSPNWENIG